MIIKKANSIHLDETFRLLKAVAVDMRSKGILQWNENYPTFSHVQEDIASEILYLALIDDKIAGVISIDDNQSPEYNEIPWEFTDGRIMVVHRLAVSPSFQKNGIGKILMDYALAHAIKEGFSSIRLDAYSQNERTLNFYKNRDYKYRGDIYFPYRKEPFNCFEKKIIV